jgi:hypothetical protein
MIPMILPLTARMSRQADPAKQVALVRQLAVELPAQVSTE